MITVNQSLLLITRGQIELFWPHFWADLTPSVFTLEPVSLSCFHFLTPACFTVSAALISLPCPFNRLLLGSAPSFPPQFVFVASCASVPALPPSLMPHFWTLSGSLICQFYACPQFGHGACVCNNKQWQNTVQCFLGSNGVLTLQRFGCKSRSEG